MKDRDAAIRRFGLKRQQFIYAFASNRFFFFRDACFPFAVNDSFIYRIMFLIFFKNHIIFLYHFFVCLFVF